MGALVQFESPNKENCKGIVIVEDDPDIREALQEVLEFQGYRVDVAENGKVAIELLSKISKPCLILLDLMMPVMTGWEFMEMKKENKGLSDIPVVVVSAVAEKATPALHKGFLQKPIEIDRLFQVVEQYCTFNTAQSA